MKIKNIAMVLFCMLHISANSQILIDENFSDWANIPIYMDPQGDGSNFGDDFVSLQVTNDDDYLYFRLELKDEILLQENNNINLYIDTDNNVNTGVSKEGIGAEIGFAFGDKIGFIHQNNFTFTSFHDDIGLTVLPSLSSKVFEFSISRTYSIPNIDSWEINGSIAIAFSDERSNGDVIPDAALDKVYTLKENNENAIPEYSLTKLGNGFRLMTYNSLFDGLFEPEQSQQQKRIIKAMDADIYAFVEIYGHSSSQIAAIIANETGVSNWDHASEGSDTHVISKYPIKDHTNIDGNGAYLIDYEGNDMLMVVAHLPAGSNDFSRQQEVDKIAAFVRDAKLGLNEFQLSLDSPIIITGDMNLYGDRRQRETLLTGDIFYNDDFGSDTNLDWDASDLTAALPFANGLPHAVTWINNNSSFFPGRLDYTIYSDYILELKNCYSLNTNGMSDSELESLGLLINDSRSGSDHLPIITDFEIKNPDANENLSISDLKITIYPNPASKVLHIEDLSDIQSIHILNSIGKMMYHGQNAITKEIDIKNWKSGVYNIRFISHDGRISNKQFVKI